VTFQFLRRRAVNFLMLTAMSALKEPAFACYRFDDVVVDCHKFSLVKGRQKKDLTPRAFDVLRYLIEHSDRVVEKQELFEQVWREKFVTDNALTRTIKEIRRVLGDSADSPRYIETVHKRGYRFVAEVSAPAGREVVYTEEVEGVSVIVEEAEQEEQTVSRGEVLAASQAAGAKLLRGGNRRHRLATLLILATLGAAIIAVAYFVIPRSLVRGNRAGAPAPGGAVTIRSIAVLPLENLSGDPAQEYFADGMTEELIGKLAQIGSLRVISRTSVMRYKAGGKSLPEIARELNVDAALEGTVQRSDGRVRVTAKLIHAATDSLLWARDYERDLTDVLKLQSDVARAVADEIRIQVTPEERARLASARSVNPKAHEAYLLGRYHYSKDNDEGWKQAIEYFERAIQIDPNHAAAYAGLSDAWIFRGLTGTVDFKEAESPTRAAALKAVELDEQLAEAHLSLARIKQQYDWDWGGAEREIRRALELDPGSLEVHTDYGYLLMHVGRLDEAIREGQLVVQFDPVSSAAHSALGRFLYRAHRYEEALPHLLRAFELEPRGLTANVRLGDLYVQLGRYDEAIAAYERAREVDPNGRNFQAAVARVYALMGRHREARQMVRGLKANPYIIAAVYTALGDKDEAFRILEKAVEEHQLITPVKVEPPLDSLHSDPRWKALLLRMNLPNE
jgi:TolB-like protein/DNA-binding winged helix-turn-helix (wHTH) protein/Flp pilus assembly protein TadD